MAKQCALCELPARMHCESDRASLCWECDARVHGANFLVARHSRRLLCRSCQSPTPWRASGARLGPTCSLCDLCLGAGVAGADGGCGMMENGERGGGRIPGRDDQDEGEDDDDDASDDDEGGNEEDRENQVVPLAIMEVQMTMKPPPLATCSSSEESSSRGRIAFCPALLKQTCKNGDLSYSQNDAGRPSPQGFSGRPSPPSSTVASTYGRMPVEEPSPHGGSFLALDDRKAATRHPRARVGSPVRPRRNTFPRGGSPSVDVVFPRCHSPPI